MRGDGRPVAFLQKAACGVVVISLASMLAMTPSSAAPDDAPSEVLPELQASDDIDGPTVGRGVVTGNSGAEVTGADVVLLAWPDDEVVEAMAVNDSVKLVPVAKARTGRNGRFELRIPAEVEMAPFEKSDGIVDFEVHATGEGEGFSTFAFSAERLEGSDSWVEPGSSGNVDARPRTVNRPAISDMTLPLRSVGKAGKDNRPNVATPERAAKACSSTYLGDYTPKWNLVGQAYVGSYITAKFTYGTNASSSLGIGFSASGAFGDWEPMGTSSKSSTGSVSFATQPQSTRKYYDTQFAYGKYRFDCLSYAGYAYKYFEARVRTWAGGARTRNVAAAPTANYCTPFQAGSSFTKATSQAQLWSNGMDMDTAIGIDLSTRTGYATNAKLTFNFINARRLCGTQDYPGGTPRQMVGHT